MRKKKNTVSEAKYKRSRVSMMPRAIDEKCDAAEMYDSAATISAGRKIKNESISVSEMQMIKAAKNAMI